MMAVFFLAAPFLLQASSIVWVTGITEPFKDVTLSASVSGVVGEVRFQEGDFVEAGQVLLQLDKRLEELEVQRRKVLMDSLQKELEATQTLFDKIKGVSREELEKKQQEHQVATAEHEIALERLKKRSITAPISGFIVDIFLEAGESAQSNDALVRMVDTRRCFFVTNVEARLGQHLRNGHKVRIQVETGNAILEVEGSITFISPIVDPASGLLKVKAVFDNKEGKMRPGLSGRIELKEVALDR